MVREHLKERNFVSVSQGPRTYFRHHKQWRHLLLKEQGGVASVAFQRIQSPGQSAESLTLSFSSVWSWRVPGFLLRGEMKPPVPNARQAPGAGDSNVPGPILSTVSAHLWGK